LKDSQHKKSNNCLGGGNANPWYDHCILHTYQIFTLYYKNMYSFCVSIKKKDEEIYPVTPSPKPGGHSWSYLDQSDSLSRKVRMGTKRVLTCLSDSKYCSELHRVCLLLLTCMRTQRENDIGYQEKQKWEIRRAYCLGSRSILVLMRPMPSPHVPFALSSVRHPFIL
jgi:hypothetical protein